MYQQRIQDKIEYMERQGWEYLPSSLDTWEWMRFADNGQRIGRQGTKLWNEDMKKYEESRENE